MQKVVAKGKLRAVPRDGLAAVQSAARTLELESEGLQALRTALAEHLGQSFGEAVDILAGARGRVIVTGMGKSGHVARKIAATLASTGTPAFFVHAADASHGDLGMITSDDVMLALSWSGETEELKELINYSRRFRIVLIAVTVNVESTLGKAADIVLPLPATRGLGSTVAQTTRPMPAAIKASTHGGVRPVWLQGSRLT